MARDARNGVPFRIITEAVCARNARRKSSREQVLHKRWLIQANSGRFFTRHTNCHSAGGTGIGSAPIFFNKDCDTMNTNQSKQFTNGLQPDSGRQTVIPDAANDSNFATGFGVNQYDMDTQPSPEKPFNPHPVRNICCVVPPSSVWEYKIGIVPTNTSMAPKEVQEFFARTWGMRGWLFVSESQGIFHFKRLKQ